MNFLNSIVSALGGNDLNAQIEQAKSDAQTVAQAVAVWGFIVVVELGVLIVLVGRKRRT